MTLVYIDHISTPRDDNHSNFAGSTLLGMDQLPPVEPLTPPSRLDNGKFTKVLEKSSVQPEAIQAILSLYDFEVLFREQPPAALDDIEKLLGFVNWPWWGRTDRAYMIAHKVRTILYSYFDLMGPLL